MGVGDGGFATFVDWGYDIAHVEHVEHGIETVTWDCAKLALGGIDGALEC